MTRAVKSWVVTIRATTTKVVTVEGCTKAEATKEPFAYAVEEHETDLIDWEVQKVEPNE